MVLPGLGGVKMKMPEKPARDMGSQEGLFTVAVAGPGFAKEAERLARNFRAFSERLPKTVEQNGRYVETSGQ
jgi:hypothetical protein